MPNCGPGVDVKRRCSKAEPPITPVLTVHQNGQESYPLLEKLLHALAETALRALFRVSDAFGSLIVTLASAVSGSSS
jgi:hypothetical protein